jgi:hypothetical protein
MARRWGWPAPYAIGINAEMMGIFLSSSIFDFPTSVGLGAVLVFFPDTCELGAFTLTRGIATTGRPLSVPFEVGLGVAAGFSVEGAVQLSWNSWWPRWHRGNASADSFVGVFRTVETPIGSLYAGVAAAGEVRDVSVNWIGFTYGLPGLSFAPIGDFAQWDYQLVQRPWNLSDCACDSLIVALF